MPGKSILLISLLTISVSFSSAGVNRPPEPDSLKGRILYATDDYFGVAENLLEDAEPIANAEHTRFGKWMDGWETRRRRIPGHDYTIIALEEPSIIYGFFVDTAFFKSNYPPHISIQAARLTKIVDDKFPPRNSQMGTAASEEAIKKMAALRTEKWEIILPRTKLGSGAPATRESSHTVNSTKIWTHLRLNMFPDGGIGRLKIYGKTSKDWDVNGSTDLIDLVAAKNGGVALGCSDDTYGKPENMIKGGKALRMTDGWESDRHFDRPDVFEIGPSGLLESPLHDWAVLRLGQPGIVETVIVDTNHFGGNSPYSAELLGAVIRGNQSAIDFQNWITILTPKVVSANSEHVYTYEEVENNGPFTHVKIIIKPDGGISRLKIMGYVQKVLDD